MAKLIIQHDMDGSVYFYHETDRHFRVAEKERKQDGLERVDWNNLASECQIEPGTYMVVPIVEGE